MKYRDAFFQARDLRWKGWSEEEIKKVLPKEPPEIKKAVQNAMSKPFSREGLVPF